MKRIVSFLIASVLMVSPLSMTITDSMLSVSAEENADLVTVDGLQFQIFGSGDAKSASLVGIEDKSITTLSIPASVDGSKVNAIALPQGSELYQYKALTAIEVDAESEYFASVDGVLFNKNMTKLIAYPVGRKGSYQIPDGTEEIEASAFFKAKELTEVTLCDSLRTIGVSAFAECTALEEIHGAIPGTMGNLFAKCKSLKSITFAEAKSDALEDAMLSSLDLTGCESLESVTIPASRVLTMYAVFTNCLELKEITIPDYYYVQFRLSVTNCPKLEQITILKRDSLSLYYELDRSTPTYGYESNSGLVNVCEENGYPFIPIGSVVPAVTRGDSNGDGVVNIMDVICVNKALLGGMKLTEEQNAAADVDGDGQVTPTDALNILKFVVEIISDFDSLT